MEGRMRFTRRLFAILWALVLLSTGAFSSCADDEECTEAAEVTIETDSVAGDLDQEEEASREGGEEIPEEEKGCRTDESKGDTDIEDEKIQEKAEPSEKADLSNKQNAPAEITDAEDDDDTLYYFLEPLYKSGTFYAPVNSDKISLRKIISKKKDVTSERIEDVLYRINEIGGVKANLQRTLSRTKKLKSRKMLCYSKLIPDQTKFYPCAAYCRLQRVLTIFMKIQRRKTKRKNRSSRKVH